MTALTPTSKAKNTKAGTKAATTTTKIAPKPRGQPRKSDTGPAQATLTPKAPTKAASIVRGGGDAITCKAISWEWPDQGEDFGHSNLSVSPRCL